MEAQIFPLQGTITYDIVKKAHERILRIGIEVRNVLEKHNIPYSLFFGSLLGAVRHKGFVPWDMDMDFGAFEDYDNTVEILKAELPDWLVVLDSSVDPNYCASWVKVVDRFSEFHATMYGGDNIFKNRGLHVDIYNISKTTYNKACDYRRQEAANYYQRKYAAGLIGERELYSFLKNVENTYKAEIAHRPTLAVDKQEYAFINLFEADTDSIFPLKQYVFEGELFYGPNDYDRFLKGCYYKGDYMELPAYEKRDLKMDSIIVNPIIKSGFAVEKSDSTDDKNL